MHNATVTVQVGKMVKAGEQIGTMGGKGKKGLNEYPQHVHYQMHDKQGRYINPEEWWGNIDCGVPPRDRRGAHGAEAALTGTIVPKRDPLALDLDGDGIETTSSRDGTVVVFDHDNGGVKTGTGWVKPDDGWLALDRDGNGTIDSNDQKRAAAPKWCGTRDRTGHQKSEGRLDRNFLRGVFGDQANALMAGIGYNLRAIIRKLRLLVAWILSLLCWAYALPAGILDFLEQQKILTGTPSAQTA